MILGTGIDIVKIGRIKKLIDRYESGFLKKIFTENEILYCNRKGEPSIHFAGRWAVKEAFYKALPVEIQQKSGWKSIEIISDNRGKPFVNVVSEELNELFKSHLIGKIHTSISHEREFAIGSIILES